MYTDIFFVISAINAEQYLSLARLKYRWKANGNDENFFLLCRNNQKFFISRLVTKSSKLKLYRTVIRPIVTYASKTWVLKETTIQKLLVFERKILRRIFGPKKENQIWRIKTNEE